jgi:mono/diheme cytochrome c family protein
MTLSMRGVGLAVASVVAGLALVACGGGGEDEEAPEATEVATAAAAATEAAGGDSAALIKGLAPEAFFAANCATCHGQKREGGVGLPLTPDKLTKEDAFYADTIKNGRDGTGMTMMGTILGMSDEEIATMVHFLKTNQP